MGNYFISISLEVTQTFSEKDHIKNKYIFSGAGVQLHWQLEIINQLLISAFENVHISPKT
jgi:hypothetical protein